jgi:hypothetical protein
MSKNDTKPWKTKYGSRRVRQEEPTLAEAIAAARDLSDDIDQQVDIAASLIGMPADQVRSELLKLAPARKDSVRSVVFTGPAQRVVVVESKRPRRVVAR